jgi:hypothetical protein
MPIYEYECGKCGEKYDQIFTSIDPDFDYDVLNCRNGCGGDAYRKMSASSDLTGKSGRCGGSSGLEGPCDDGKKMLALLIPLGPFRDGSSEN